MGAEETDPRRVDFFTSGQQGERGDSIGDPILLGGRFRAAPIEGEGGDAATREGEGEGIHTITAAVGSPGEKDHGGVAAPAWFQG